MRRRQTWTTSYSYCHQTDIYPDNLEGNSGEADINHVSPRRGEGSVPDSVMSVDTCTDEAALNGSRSSATGRREAWDHRQVSQRLHVRGRLTNRMKEAVTRNDPNENRSAPGPAGRLTRNLDHLLKRQTSGIETTSPMPRYRHVHRPRPAKICRIQDRASATRPAQERSIEGLYLDHRRSR